MNRIIIAIMLAATFAACCKLYDSRCRYRVVEAEMRAATLDRMTFEAAHIATQLLVEIANASRGVGNDDHVARLKADAERLNREIREMGEF